MNAHPARLGNFTSSEIGRLMTYAKNKVDFGAPALSYIQECNFERQLNRPIDSEIFSKATSWGSLAERYVMSNSNLLGLEYIQRPDEPIIHPKFPYWSGTPDMTKADTVCDLKSPYTLLSFCQLVQPLYDGFEGMDAINKIRDTHKEGDKYYWQILSNAILTNSSFGELIIFMPYLTEIGDIKSIAHLSEGKELSKFYSIAMADDEDLPYLIKGGRYKNLNIIRFPIHESDKQLLTERVIEAGKKLVVK